eukprot:SAG31_NODE_19554_length_599_cov_0.584000_2_plen_35_part_01
MSESGWSNVNFYRGVNSAFAAPVVTAVFIDCPYLP